MIMAIVLLFMCTGVQGFAFADPGLDPSGKVPLALIKQWEKFNSPSDVAVDSFGNVLVADTNNQAVKIIYANDTVRTIAGGFKHPVSVAVASNGEIYVGDSGYNYSGAVRMIHANGTITTLKSGYACAYVALDSRDNVYVADVNKNSRGVVEVFYTNGTSAVLTDGLTDPAPCYPPDRIMEIHGIAVDCDNTVYVEYGKIISKVYQNGTIRDINLHDLYLVPCGIAVDSKGTIYTGSLDYSYTALQCYRICTNGTVQVLGDERFNRPGGIDVDPMGNVYVADTRNDMVKEIYANGTIRVLGGEFKKPREVTAGPNGNVYVTDSSGPLVREISSDGTIETRIDNISQLGRITVDPYDNIYMVDLGLKQESVKVLYTNGTTRKLCNKYFYDIAVDSKGKLYAISGLLYLIDTTGNAKLYTEDQDFIFASMNSLTVDSQGNVYVAFNNDEVRTNSNKFGVKKIDQKGKITALGAQSEFRNPIDLCVDPAGAVYVADSGHGLVKMITKKGVIKTFDHTFNHPRSVAVDNHGHLYVIDDNGLMEFSV